MSITERVVVLIDMDCFYCQVEEKLDPNLEGQPIAVVQYNPWRGGGIIAVNYPARDQGVTRHMRGDDAKARCPIIRLVRVPEVRGKADLTKYRNAGKKVADVLQTFTPLLTRASVDEAYLDITESVKKRIENGLSDLKIDNMRNTFIVGCDTEDFIHNIITNEEFNEADLRLAVGALITEEIRAEVYKKTGYKCSAGIAHNKILAKLVCSLHKPNKQTVLPQQAVSEFFKTTKVTKITGLGGKFGHSLAEDFGITYVGELVKYSEKELSQKYDDKTAHWLYNLARGIDMEPVTPKMLSKSIASCKNFTGRSALTTAEAVEHWLTELAEEISERLEKDLEDNNRKAKQIVVSFIQDTGQKEVSSSRTHPLVSYDHKRIAQSAFEVVKKFCLRADGTYNIKFLGISAGNFEGIRNVREITSFFKKESCVKNLTNTVKSESSVDKKEKVRETNNIDEKQYDGGSTTATANTESYPNFNDNSKSNDTIDNLDWPELAQAVGGKKHLEGDSDNDDIYSQKTLELDENSQDLVFYDDKYRTTKGQTPNSKSGENSSNNDGQSRKESHSPTLSSFFRRYFQSTSTNRSADCDTKNSEVPNNNNDALNSDVSLDDQREDIYDDEEPSDLCPECNKMIPISEIISHQDYHFALKLSKDESNLTSTSKPPETPPSNNKQSAKRGRKRKTPETQHNNALMTAFFKKQDDSHLGDVDDTAEICPECQKRIKLEEMASHMDYHAAKKLHQEINSFKSATVSKVHVKKSNKKRKNDASLLSFLKPL